jgi:XRE family transcriptional regulator, master regulator for biofilm formation
MMKNKQQLDANWLRLVKELMESEVSKENFRAFIEFKKLEKENKKMC